MMQAANVDLVAVGPGQHALPVGLRPHPDEHLCLLLVSLEKAGLIIYSKCRGCSRSYRSPVEHGPMPKETVQALRRAVSGTLRQTAGH